MHQHIDNPDLQPVIDLAELVRRFSAKLPAEELKRLWTQTPIPSEDAGPGLFARYARHEGGMAAVVVGRAAPEYVALLTEKGLVVIKASFADLRAEWWDGIPEPSAP